MVEGVGEAGALTHVVQLGGEQGAHHVRRAVHRQPNLLTELIHHPARTNTWQHLIIN